ncbi:MAG: NADPH:quinone oxidoreductase family protein [Pseudomonadota bacterium]
MRAVLCKGFNGPDALVIEEVTRPGIGEDDVRIAVHAASVNFHDLLMVKGLYQKKLPLPFIAGSEAAGEVIEVGANVTRLHQGDRVALCDYSGAFAGEMAGKELTAVRLPDGVDYLRAAALRTTYGTAYYALVRRAHIKPEEVLLVHGAAGGLGLAAVDLGRHLGARVIGCVGSDEKMAIVREYGAEYVINTSTDSVRENVLELTGGNGADVILDMVGGDLFDQSLRCINWDGRLLVLGFTSGRIPSIPVNLVLLKSCFIIGVFYFAWMERKPEESRRDLEMLLGWVAEGKIRPHISMTFPLEQAADAMNLIAARKVMGKVVLRVR